MEEGIPIFLRKKQEKSPMDAIKEELKKRKKVQKAVNLSEEEKKILQQIKRETQEWNKNNVTRTKAYLDFYRQYPEVHWAFLGHMVSRNGGWNMTDLKGELLSRLLSDKEKQSFFSFLERGNWLIFQDAYPQFLIYRESLKRNRPLFFLFPFFNISVFMEATWNCFWRNPQSNFLTIALIINEQSYLEKRVIQNHSYKHDVFQKLEFKLQELLSLNHILFPYKKGGATLLRGQTLYHFESLHERILLGKRLYAVLFRNKDVLALTEQWANRHPHTGSRKDYWPNIFNVIHEGLPGEKYQFQLKSCKLRPGGRRIFSPTLEHAWENVRHAEAEKGDWFDHDNGLNDFNELEDNINGEIQDAYCQTLERLELAALAKKAVTNWH
ncbi:DUF2515 family protein [Bacillus sp. ISL-47]|uniref:DUF2515 family protein n=1 Tax=Bacillus sp. ISL-47 TaxID=2819130 RepID=UPI001BE902EC|nr:DUF2515 family protein [Bacillus sp. ISL-47]MBT2686817.1 DUF2515 family protein [Bacillus sp. ISL-47]MBT2706830.1 DUF2515 family protein [Pseudomonas sp. ISL-84]